MQQFENGWCLCAGVSLWYDLHGASHAGLEAANDLLAEHPAVHTELGTERPHHWALRPHAACLPAAHLQRDQGVHANQHKKNFCLFNCMWAKS